MSDTTPEPGALETPATPEESTAALFAARVAECRSAYGLTRDQVGELLGKTGRDIAAWEEQTRSPSVSEAITLHGVLGFEDPWTAGLDGPAVAELDRHAARLGCWGPHAPLLAWARRLYLLDERVTYSVANVPPLRTDLDADTIAAACPAPALAPVAPPALEGAGRRPVSTAVYRPGNELDYAADGVALVGLLRAHLGLSAEPVDPTMVAARLGVQVAAAPAAERSWTKALLLRLAGTALVVTNARLHPVTLRHSVAHLLGHFVAGDAVGPGLIDRVEDQDDDSIYHCGGASAWTCDRADAFAAELLVPADWLRAWAGEHSWPTPQDAADPDEAWRHGLRFLAMCIRNTARRCGVDPHLVHDQARALGLLSEEQDEQLAVALERRRPLGGAARRGADAATHSEDFALPDGDGAHRIPAALRARVLAAWAHGALFTPPAELIEDADFSEADRERIRAEDRARHEALKARNAAQVAELFAAARDTTDDDTPDA